MLMSCCNRSAAIAPVKGNAAGSLKLSPREKEIIVKLAWGIATRRSRGNLDLSESTVKIHVQGILRKLNLASRVQAAVYAVEHGLVVEK
jgi:two-component system nitrate/nitrite response regulator NarL